MLFLNFMLNILTYENIFCEIDESIALRHDPSGEVVFLGVHSQSIFPFMEFFFSQENCVSFGLLVYCLLLSQSAEILLVNLLWVFLENHFYLMNNIVNLT